MPKSIFLSSTAKDLSVYREAVYSAIEGLDGYNCVRMETFGARDWNAADFCRQKVGECDIFLCIVGQLYGSTPKDSQQSYTEIEYEAALSNGKPILIFLTPENFGVPANLLQAELNRSDKWERQQRFRERVSGDRVADSFTTPEDLAGRVRQAIFNLERNPPDEEPNLGPLVPRMCDRTAQESDFRRFFSLCLKRRPGAPQFYFVHGGEREVPASLIERFRLTRVRNYAQYKWGEQKATVPPLWETDWPQGRDLVSRQEELKASLIERIDPTFSLRDDQEYSAQALGKLLAADLNPVIVIQHDLPLAACNSVTLRLISWYLEFWDEVKSSAHIPQVLVFLNVIYPHVPKGSLLTPWLLARRLRQKLLKRRLQDNLRAICQLPGRAPEASSAGAQSTCVMLDELTCVKLDELMAWFRRHKIGRDDREREQQCREIFKKPESRKLAKCINMLDVEHALNKVHVRMKGIRA